MPLALRIGFFIALFVGSLAGVWGFLIEPGLLKVREVEIASERWPRDWAPLKIALLADLHVGAPFAGLEKLREVVSRVNGLQPDLVLLAGDYVIHGVLFGSFVPPEAIAKELRRLEARLGVVSVLANHDWWYGGDLIRQDLEAQGITVLENEARSFRHPRGQFWVAGLADDTTRQPDPIGTLRRVPAEEPVIVLVHDPVTFLDVPHRAVVTLAAHTHGGQVYLPWFGAPIVPGRGPRRFAYGHIREDDKDMYVTSGIGTSILPVRFNMPPEIALLTIRGWR